MPELLSIIAKFRLLSLQSVFPIALEWLKGEQIMRKRGREGEGDTQTEAEIELG